MVEPTTSPATRRALIDCDVHVNVPRVEVLFPYLPIYWREHITQTLFKGPVESSYPKNAPITARPGSIPPDSGVAGSSLDLLRTQVLDAANVEYAIVNCSYAIDSLHNPDAAVALASAVNDWLIREWLEKEPRLRASLVVPSQIPALAAREIDRVGDHPGFVQVYLPVRSQHPYGSRLFHPLWEAIARHGLVAGIHFGGIPGVPPTPSGWPSYYLEEYAGMAQVFQSQVVSIISEGVFDLFPNLRIVLIEGGFTWLPSFMWRFDKEWRNLRRLVPWVRRPPSAYIREHMRFTIQPLDLPPDPRQLLQVIDQIGSEDILLYASDYPHLHAADPEEALFPHLSETLVRKIRSENARALYRFT
ncbi:MAG TPA: amidohydrolase family protein [Chloroflexota bacterium]|nr:amidohydrolase family protein [Chloroflexota bacterium]